MGILALIPDSRRIRRERQMDGIAKAKERGNSFGRKLDLTPEKIAEIRSLRAAGTTVPDIIRRVGLSKATVYRALNSSPSNLLANKEFSIWLVPDVVLPRVGNTQKNSETSLIPPNDINRPRYLVLGSTYRRC